MPNRIILASRPAGVPVPENFRLEAYPVPTLAPGEILVETQILSMDPAIRGFLDDRPSYLPPVALGAPIRGMSLGRVVESRRSSVPVGAMVRSLADWSELTVLGPDALGFEMIEADPGTRPETLMGALGPVGLTAWIGLHEIGRIGAGETVLISAAAGATGSVAGQIAKRLGCRVIGLVGSAAKAERILALGFDRALDYRAEPDLDAALAAAAGAGIDVFFDNVGGATLERVLPHMRERGRVVVCGMVGQYNEADHPYGVKTLWQVVVKRLTLRGFLTYDHADRLAEAQADLAALVRSGAITPFETLYQGLEAAPRAFIDLMSGATMGKTLVKLGP